MVNNDRRRVIVGVSQSMAGLAAVRFAQREAHGRDMVLYAVRAWALPSHWRGSAVTAWEHELRTEAHRYVVEAFDAAVGGLPSDTHVQVTTPNGRADHVLVDAAPDERDLLVLGGRSRWRRLWPSWVVRSCLSTAQCPVIVVPPPDLARSAWLLPRRRMSRAAERLTADSATHHQRLPHTDTKPQQRSARLRHYMFRDRGERC